MKYISFFCLFVTIIILSCVSTEVDVSGSLRGVVKDAYTNLLLEDCNVSIEATPYSTRTNSKGEYQIEGIDMGKYLIKYSATNYLPLLDSIQIVSDQVTNKDVYMSKMGKPNVVTSPAKEITHHSAILSASIVQNGGSDIIEKGFLWGKEQNNLVKSLISSQSDLFELKITELDTNTTYYYKAFATNDLGIAYGDLVSFTTDFANSGSVKTKDATEITGISAKLNAEITSMPKSGVSSIGFYWGDDENNLNQRLCCDNSGSSLFYYCINTLNDDTKYFYKAFLTSDAGEICGETVGFKTLSITKPNVTTKDPSNVSETSVILNAQLSSNGNDSNTEFGFVYGISSNSMNNKIKVGIETLGSYSINVNNLNKLTTYYFRAYAQNKKGTTYGDIKKFDTPNFNGHEYVDLGLPSGKKWSKYNIGSSDLYSPGNYYIWAESINSFTDIASLKLGGTWTMPTKEDIDELYKNCQKKHTTETRNGVTTHWSEYTGPNGNVLIIPDTGIRHTSSGTTFLSNSSSGYYWTTTPDEDINGNPYKVQRAYLLETNTTSSHSALWPINYQANIRAVSK